MNATAVTTKMQHALTFGAHEVRTITREGQLWMSAAEVGRALEYASPDAAIAKVYAAHADEFTTTMTKIIKVMTAGGKQAVRFFSLRGAHLLGMFARTPKAKAFRAWVLDILDQEAKSLLPKARNGRRISSAELESLQGLCSLMEFLYSWFRRVYPGLKVLAPSLAAAAHDRFGDGVIIARAVVHDHGLESSHAYAANYPWDGSFTDRQEYRRRMKMGRMTLPAAECVQ